MTTKEASRATKEGAIGVRAACEFLGIGRSHLYRLMDAGELKFVKVGSRRLLPKAELRRFLADRLRATQGAD